MDAPVVVVSTVAGLLAGWFVLVPVIERIPEPTDVPRGTAIAVTVANGALWGIDAVRFGKWFEVAGYALVFSALLAVSVIDLRIYRIPNRIVFPTLAAAAVLFTTGAIALHRSERITYAVVGLLVYFGILFVFHVAYPKGMGFGDVKLALLMGLTLGWLGQSVGDAVYLVFLALFLGSVFGIVFGLVARIVRGKGGAFPFGPALAAAHILIVLTVGRYLSNLHTL